MLLSKDEFICHHKIQKLAKTINKRAKEGYNFINTRDVDLIKILYENEYYLDFIGLTIKMKNEKTISIIWKDL